MGSRGKSGKKSILGRKGKGLFDRIPNMYDAIKVVNPNYDPHAKSLDWRWNCARCTVAGALQLMGYDVQAAKWDGKWYGFDTVFDFDWTKHEDYIAPSSNINWNGTDYRQSRLNPNKAKQRGGALAEQIDEQMKKWGLHSFAALNVQWKGKQSAHTILVFREKYNTTLIDFQSGTMHTGLDAIKRYMEQVQPSKTGLYRLDNKKIKKDETNFDKVIKRS